jgi:phage-related holin
MEHFFSSLLRPKLLALTIPFAAIGGFIDYIFGLQPIVFTAFVALLTIELVSGIFASWIEGKEITSKRMKAFLMMLFVWLVVLFIINAFHQAYEATDIGFVFHYLFDVVIIFVNLF